MKYIAQPNDKPVCGQACVAMLAGVSLEMACAAMLHYGSSSIQDIRRALTHLGVSHSKRMEKFKGRFKGVSLVLLHNRNSPLKDNGKPYGHWSIWDGAKFLDPAYGEVGNYPDGFYISYFMPVTI